MSYFDDPEEYQRQSEAERREARAIAEEYEEMN
jgi:hypothetical protein